MVIIGIEEGCLESLFAFGVTDELDELGEIDGAGLSLRIDDRRGWRRTEEHILARDRPVLPRLDRQERWQVRGLLRQKRLPLVRIVLDQCLDGEVVCQIVGSNALIRAKWPLDRNVVDLMQ